MNEKNQQKAICPDSNLVWAILCTILCCLPLGIVAIVKAASVEKLWNEGRQLEAQKASDDAKKYSIWGAAISVILTVLYFLFIFILAAAGSAF